jgi:uncharacterized protein (TIGR02996 family)
MTTTDPIYRTIIERPRDIAARLVWSDWLEEQGDADHSAFVRVQCELAKCACCCDEKGWCYTCTLRRRERELLEAIRLARRLAWLPEEF